MPADDTFSELLPAYALGALDSDEQHQVEAHLATCQACQAALHTYEQVVGELSFAVPDAVPPPALEARLLNRVRGKMKEDTAVSPPKPTLLSRLRQLYRQPITRRAILVVMGVLLVMNLLLWQQVTQLRAPEQPSGMVALPMVSTNEAKDASGFFLVSADGLSGAVIVDDVPQLADDLQYQLWLYRQDGRVEKDVAFNVDALGYGGKWVSPAESLQNYSHFSITMEPIDGSDQPTGATVFTGTFP